MSRLRRPHPRPARLRPRSAAQAFVEFALAAPFVLLLVAGAAQIGAVAYGMVSSDTAAREGARYGATHPNAALPGFSSNGGGTHHCVYANDNESVPTGNPICQAVYRAHGLLDPTQFDITITSNVPVMSWQVPSDVVRVGQPLPCGSDAEVDGTITFDPAPAQRQKVTITATGQGTVPSTTVQGNQTAYRLCLAVNTTQTLNAVMGSGCGGYSGQATVSVQQSSSMPYTPTPDPLVLTPNPCPTPQPSQTPNPTPTPAPTATPVPTDAAPPPFTCTNAAAQSNGYYFTVTVKYPVAIFVPVVGTLIGDPNNSTQRTVQASVTERVEPCAITGNQ